MFHCMIQNIIAIVFLALKMYTTYVIDYFKYDSQEYIDTDRLYFGGDTLTTKQSNQLSKLLWRKKIELFYHIPKNYPQNKPWLIHRQTRNYKRRTIIISSDISPYKKSELRGHILTTWPVGAVTHAHLVYRHRICFRLQTSSRSFQVSWQGNLNKRSCCAAVGMKYKCKCMDSIMAGAGLACPHCFQWQEIYWVKIQRLPLKSLCRYVSYNFLLSFVLTH